MKIILPALANQSDFIRRFEGEAQVVARLEHPHIVPLHDYWRDPEGAYLVMRWLRGGSLQHTLKTGRFELRAAALLLDQIGGALSLAHRNGIIHRDIKPANILLDEDGNAYLTDFGIAKDLNIQGNNTQPDVIVGSLDYISPEQARSEPVTNRTDIYSLGVTLFEMITGHHPFENMSSIERLYKHINDPLPEIAGLDSEVADQVNFVIQKATAKKPEQRYADALAFAADFREAIGLNRASTTVVELLTQREHEILALIIEGLSNKDIAQKLTITYGTVKWYVSQIYDKLGVRSRVQAMVRARELNLLSKGNESLEVLQIATEDFNPDNPYKGLRAFQSADNQDFFGREKLTAKLLKRMAEKVEFGRFLAVVGPSGSGKSSLVKAGLIPALWRGELPASEKWYIVELTPATHPVDELEIALMKLAANQAANLHEQLNRDTNGLLRVANLVLPNDGTELVLVIDQFEEVFTMLDNEAERKHFLDLLYAAVSDAKSRVRVIITLRADFYDRPLHYPQFGEMLRSRLETLLPLSAEELERAISKPAERVGVVFEAGLVASMVADMNYQAGALPLLQYALTELFEHRQGRLLSREVYEAMGKSTGALARRADEIYESFDELGKAAAKQVFLRLVTVMEGAEDTRRRASRMELLALGEDAEIIEDVIDSYSSYRLLTLDNEPLSRTSTVELAHEAILREWERLWNWLNESRDELRIQRQLSAMTQEWAEAKRDKSFLARGSRLENFKRCAESTEILLTPLEREFINKSIEGRKDEAEREAEQQAREKVLKLRSQRFLQALVALFALATLLSGGLAAYAFTQEAESDASLLRSEALRLAGAANVLLPGDSTNAELAALLAIRALNLSYSTEADTALLRASQYLYTEAVYSVSEDASYFTAHFDGNNLNLLMVGSDNSLHISNPETGEARSGFQGIGDALIRTSVFNADSSLLAVIYFPPEDKLGIWDYETGELIYEIPSGFSLVSDVSFSPDGQYLALSGDGQVLVWNLGTNTEIQRLPMPHLRNDSVQYSHNGRFLMVGMPGRSVLLDAESFETVQNFDGHGGFVFDIAFSSDDSLLATVSNDGTARLWDVATGEELRRFTGHWGRVSKISFSPDNSLIITGSDDNTARLWDVRTGQELRRLSGHEGNIFNGALEFSEDGQQVLSVRQDATIRLWNTDLNDEPYQLLSHEFQIDALSISNNGLWAAIGADGALWIWDMQNFGLARELPIDAGEFVENAVFSPDNRYLLTAHTEGIRLWDTSRWEEAGRVGEGLALALAFSPDSSEFAVGFLDGHLEIRDTLSLELLHQTQAFDGRIWTLDYSTDGQYLIAHQMDSGAFLILDKQRNPVFGDMVDIVGGASALELSPSGNLLLIGSIDGAVQLWDLETQESLYRLETDNPINIFDVAFSADGSMISASRLDGNIWLWDTSSGRLLRQFSGHTSSVKRLAFSPDGVYLLSAGLDGTVRYWYTDYETQIAESCRGIFRDFSPSEREQYGIQDTNATCPNE